MQNRSQTYKIIKLLKIKHWKKSVGYRIKQGVLRLGTKSMIHKREIMPH